MDEIRTAAPCCFRKGRRTRRSTSRCPLTEEEEEAPLVTLAVSLALGTTTDAAVDVVVAGAALEAFAPGVGILRETPTAPQTCSAKARVTARERKGGRAALAIGRV